MKDDLLPSGTDKQSPAQAGTIGPSVGQIAPDFTLSDTFGTTVHLATEITATNIKGFVLYFTMWCPTCDAHMTDIRSVIMPQHPDVLFFGVDYVSGTVTDSRNAQLSYGYDNSGFIILADTSQSVLALYRATMGTTVVIDKNGIVHMNEDYKSSKLQGILSGLP
jgi:peroxiredoxin